MRTWFDCHGKDLMAWLLIVTVAVLVGVACINTPTKQADSPVTVRFYGNDGKVAKVWAVDPSVELGHDASGCISFKSEGASVTVCGTYAIEYK